MRVRFFIEKRRGGDGKLLTRDRPIFMTVAYSGNRVLLSTGKNVDLQMWSPEKQRVSEVYSEAAVINGWLNSLEYTAGVVWKSLASLSENPGVAEFREQFEKMRPRFSGGFFDLMVRFIEEGGTRWSANTYKKVRTFYNQLKEFERAAPYEMRFNTIDEAFLEIFKSYQEKKGRSVSTILKMTNTLVWFLNWASKEGYNVYYDYRKFYKLLDKPGQSSAKELYYLKWEEVMLIYNLEIDPPVQQRVRDLFCIMCFSGLRFGEISRLQKGDVDESFIHIRKSGKSVRKVPLNKYAKELILRYDNRYYRNNAALPPISMVTLNKHLRIIGEKAGLNRLVAEQSAFQKKTPLHELLTAGIAVQTFIMNALQLGIPADVITACTGVASDQRIKLLKYEITKREIEKFNTI